MTALLLALALSCFTPHGDYVEARGELEPLEVPAFIPSGWAQVVRRVNETPMLYWIKCDLHTGGTMTWDRGERVFLVLPDSSEVRDSLVLVSEPKESMTMRATRLGISSERIEADRLWSVPCRGGTCTRLLVGFPRRRLPRSFTLREALRLEVHHEADGVGSGAAGDVRGLGPRGDQLRDGR